MSFDKLSFEYTPPPTLPVELEHLEAPGADDDLPPVGTRATTMIAKLQNLRDTAAYLQTVLEPHGRSLVLPLDYRRNPELEQSFRRLYQSDPPPAMNWEMYKALVATENNLVRTEIELNRENQVNPQYTVSAFQKSDLHAVLNYFEAAAAETGEFGPNLAIVYRELSGDQILLDEAVSALGIYKSAQRPADPASPQVITPTTGDSRNPFDVLDTGAGQAGGIRPLSELNIGQGPSPGNQVIPPEDIPVTDLPADLYRDLEKTWEPFGRRYGAIYDISRGIDCILSDIAQLLEAFIAQPLKTINEILTTLKILKIMFHKVRLKQILSALAVVLLPMLIAYAFRQLAFLDNLVQKALDPLRNRLAGIYQKLADLTRFSSKLTSGITNSRLCNRHDLTGLIKQAALMGIYRNAAGMIQGHGPEWMRIENLDKLTYGADVVRNLLNFAAEEPMRARHHAQRQLIKMIDKRTAVSGDRLEILSHLKSVDTLIAVLNGVARELQLMNGPNNLVGLNATRAAAGMPSRITAPVTDKQTAAAEVPDLKRMIAGIQPPGAVELSIEPKTKTGPISDITQQEDPSTALSESEIRVVRAPVSDPPDNVHQVLVDVGATVLDTPDQITTVIP